MGAFLWHLPRPFKFLYNIFIKYKTGYVIVGGFLLLLIYIFSLGLQILFTFIFTNFWGVYTKGQVIERRDGVRCSDTGRYYSSNTNCSEITSKYWSTDGQEYTLSDKVFTEAIQNREIALTYNSLIPSIAFYECNKFKMTFVMVFYMAVSSWLMPPFYKELFKIRRKEMRENKQRPTNN